MTRHFLFGTALWTLAALWLPGSPGLIATALAESGEATAGEGPAPSDPEATAPAKPAPGARADCPPGIGCVTRRPLPRYVTLKGAEARARRGPGADHRVDWIYQRQGLPLKVTAEYENWRRIEDSEGAGGWIHFALLSNNRAVIFRNDLTDLYNSADGHGSVVARAEANAVARLLECEPDWCRVSQDGIRGWVRKSEIWGVEPGETFR